MTPSFVHQLVFAQRRSAHGVMLAYLSKHAFNDDFVDSRKNILVSNLLVEGASDCDYYKHRRSQLTKKNDILY